jgi:hypothetical protein
MFSYRDMQSCTGELKMTLFAKPTGNATIDRIKDRRMQMDADIKMVHAAMYPFGGFNAMALIMDDLREWTSQLDYISRNAKDKYALSLEFNFSDRPGSSIPLSFGGKTRQLDLNERIIIRFDYCDIWQTATGILPIATTPVQFLLLSPGSAWKLMPRPLIQLSPSVSFEVNAPYIRENVKMKLDTLPGFDIQNSKKLITN